MRRTILTAGVLFAAVLAGCGSSGPAAAKPEPPRGWEIDRISGNNGNYYDVASWCNHGNRLYQVGSDQGALMVAPNDPSCAEVPR